MNELFKYYSQNGEDFLMWKFFDFKSKGFFVDVGAFDGVHLSNSYSFELAGWTGVCIEPNPIYFQLCKINRPASKCHNVACVDNNQKGTLLFNTDSTGLFSSARTIGDDKNIIGHYGELNGVELNIETIEVESSSLNSILSGMSSGDTKIDFITIDVEGAELEVLKGFNIEKYKPCIICIEENNKKTNEKISSHLKQFGYYWARKTKNNSFYVTNSGDCERINDIQINCIIEKQIHPFGRDFTIPSFLNGLALHDGLDVYKKYQRIINENSSLIQFKKQVQSYQEKIKKFDGWLKEQRELIDKKNLKISKLESEHVNLNATISDLNSLLNNRDKEIDDLTQLLSRSFSKKIKRFLRKYAKGK